MTTINPPLQICVVGGLVLIVFICIPISGIVNNILPDPIDEALFITAIARTNRVKQGHAFWNEVDKVMPDYRERKEWLRKYGASLVL